MRLSAKKSPKENRKVRIRRWTLSRIPIKISCSLTVVFYFPEEIPTCLFIPKLIIDQSSLNSRFRHLRQTWSRFNESSSSGEEQNGNKFMRIPWRNVARKKCFGNWFLILINLLIMSQDYTVSDGDFIARDAYRPKKHNVKEESNRSFTLSSSLFSQGWER